MLRHHLHIIRVASEHRLCSDEMYSCSYSLYLILVVLQTKTNHLEGALGYTPSLLLRVLDAHITNRSRLPPKIA